jgi:ribosomal protein S14
MDADKKKKGELSVKILCVVRFMLQKNILKDILRRQSIANGEMLTYLIKNLNFYIRVKILHKHYYFMSFLLINEKKKNLKNMCILSLRSRSIYRNVRISRIKLRKLSLLGYLPGFRKSSW